MYLIITIYLIIIKNMFDIQNKKGKKYNYLNNYTINNQFNTFSICIENVFNHIECNKLIKISEQNGYENASLFEKNGKKIFYNDIRNGLRCVIDDINLASIIEQRISHIIPQEYKGKKYHSINTRFRFLKYNDSEHYFKPHTDGCYSTDKIMSMITILIYLNDDYVGTKTSIHKDLKTIIGEIEPNVGLIYLMDQNILHIVPNLISGTKYVIRTELMYSI